MGHLVGRRLPQAAPGCPYLSYESQRSLTGPVVPLYRGTEAWEGRSGPRSDARSGRRAETEALEPERTPARAHAADASANSTKLHDGGEGQM